jgi:hypothetical protein
MSEERKESYVYILFRPNGVPCYVGKGVGDRWLAHERQTHNSHLARIIKKAGGSLPKVKIRENLTDAEACETEKAFITAIGRKANGGPLVNMTDGGDGLAGYVHTELSREKIGIAHRGKIVSEDSRDKMRNARLGKSFHTKEGLERIAALSAVRNRTPEFKAKVAAGRAAMSAEAKAALGKAISDAKKGKPMSMEQRRWISENQKGQKRGPYSDERKAAISAAKKGKPMSEAHRAALKAAWVLRRAREEQPA